jgi:uncharacterized membrane protein YbhN (UPF0104 family)
MSVFQVWHSCCFEYRLRRVHSLFFCLGASEIYDGLNPVSILGPIFSRLAIWRLWIHQLLRRGLLKQKIRSPSWMANLKLREPKRLSERKEVLKQKKEKKKIFIHFILSFIPWLCNGTGIILLVLKATTYSLFAS